MTNKQYKQTADLRLLLCAEVPYEVAKRPYEGPQVVVSAINEIPNHRVDEIQHALDHPSGVVYVVDPKILRITNLDIPLSASTLEKIASQDTFRQSNFEEEGTPAPSARNDTERDLPLCHELKQDARLYGVLTAEAQRYGGL